jgi:O-antigen/teichoic acid export membrane protein
MSVLWSFALPGILIGVVYAFVQWMGRVILVNSEHGYGDLGLFAAANQWRSIILFLPAVVGRVFLPLLSEARGTSSSQTYRKMVIDNIRVICAVSLPVCAVVIAFSSPLMAIFGKGFHGGEEILPLLMLSAFFYSIGGPVRQAVDSSGLRWQALSINCIWAIVFLFLATLVVPHRGGIGLAYAHVISAGVLVTMQYLFLDRVICRGTLKAIGAGLIYSLGIVMGIAFVEYSTVLSRAVMVTAILVVLSTLPACQLLLRNSRQVAVYMR